MFQSLVLINCILRDERYVYYNYFVWILDFPFTDMMISLVLLISWNY